ncbi:hypothetical protein K438DRAFT_543725 [Mycena galopus ATCC 62051]|nr:hypothetical protein K438DRAFT_543725 [Mycena galopus ATCC 62051]
MPFMDYTASPPSPSPSSFALPPSHRPPHAHASISYPQPGTGMPYPTHGHGRGRGAQDLAPAGGMVRLAIGEGGPSRIDGISKITRFSLRSLRTLQSSQRPSKTSKTCRSPKMSGLCREGSTNSTETSDLCRVLKDLEFSSKFSTNFVQFSLKDLSYCSESAINNEYIVVLNLYLPMLLCLLNEALNVQRKEIRMPCWITALWR